MKKSYYLISSIVAVLALTACNKTDNGSVDNTVESNVQTTVSEFYSESDTDKQDVESSSVVEDKQTQGSDAASMAGTEKAKTVPQFLADIADEVVVDEKDFSIWETENQFAYFYKGWENNGFAPCELVIDGVRCQGMYTESGVAIIAVKNEDADLHAMVIYKDKSMMLDEAIIPYFYENYLNVYFNDFDNDGEDELVVHTWQEDVDGEPGGIAVLKLEPFEEMTFGYKEPEDFVSLSNMSITDVKWINKDEIEYTFKVQDWYGNEYDGWGSYHNFIKSYSIPENDEYYVDSWIAGGYGARGDKIWRSYSASMTNGSSVSSSLLGLKIYYTYDSEKNEFVSDTATLNIRRINDGVKADMDEEIEIKSKD